MSNANRINPFPHIIAELVVRRHLLGLRQVDIATQLGVGRQTVEGWETGFKNPSLAHLAAWCDLLGVALVARDTHPELEPSS